MAKITVSLSDWLDYLKSRVDIDLYVYSGNGELFVNQMPRLCKMELIDHSEKEALANTDRVLTLCNKRLMSGIDLFKIRGEDCSGLAVKFLLEKGIIKSDTSANGLYTKTKGHEIDLKDVKAGDYLFMGNANKKWHVGYAISNKYAIESESHDVGVVQTKIADRGWKYATRPDWYEGIEPEPEKPVLDRELYLTDPYMRGDDVREAQRLLTEQNYNCGELDGIYGTKTMIATKNFQHDNKITEDGVIGKVTATLLGFTWEG